jgi:hypothetical protein
MIKWFAANNLVLNSDKTNIIKFIKKNASHSTLHIGYKEETMSITFLVLQTDNYINWKNHTEEMITKVK